MLINYLLIHGVRPLSVECVECIPLYLQVSLLQCDHPQIRCVALTSLQQVSGELTNLLSCQDRLFHDDGLGVDVDEGPRCQQAL